MGSMAWKIHPHRYRLSLVGLVFLPGACAWLGALTTTFTPPADCGPADATGGGGNGFEGTPDRVTFFHFGCDKDKITCCPPNYDFSTSYSYRYYSPAICPSGYTEGILTSSLGFEDEAFLAPTLTQAHCCPIGFAYDDTWGCSSTRIEKQGSGELTTTTTFFTTANPISIRRTRRANEYSSTRMYNSTYSSQRGFFIPTPTSAPKGTQSEKSSSNTPVIVGVSVGVSCVVGTLLIVLIISRCRKRDKVKNANTGGATDDSGPNEAELGNTEKPGVPQTLPPELPPDLAQKNTEKLPHELPEQLPQESPQQFPYELAQGLPAELPTELPSELPTGYPAGYRTELPVVEQPQELQTRDPRMDASGGISHQSGHPQNAQEQVTPSNINRPYSETVAVDR